MFLYLSMLRVLWRDVRQRDATRCKSRQRDDAILRRYDMI